MIFFPFYPSGIYSVGSRDFTFHAIIHGKEEGETIKPEQHAVGRIYYPAQVAPKSSLISRIFNVCLWLPHLCYAYGYTQFLFFFVRTDKSWKIWFARVGVQLVLTVMGMLCCLSCTYNAPLASKAASGKAAPSAKDPETTMLKEKGHEEQGRTLFPVVLFSHGLAGTRNTYSSICIELASEGFIVVAVEHADGTASTARLAPGRAKSGPSREWMFYCGLGDEHSQFQKTRFRVQELRTVRRLLEAMNKGQAVDGLWVSGTDLGSGSSGWLQGCVDLSRVAVAGHSYGGATAALAAAEHYPEFKAAVAMDPWWGALPSDCSVIARGVWPSKAPILVLGSHAWNTPQPLTGKLACNGEKQEMLLAAAKGQKAAAGQGTESKPLDNDGNNGATAAAVAAGEGALGPPEVADMKPGDVTGQKGNAALKGGHFAAPSEGMNEGCVVGEMCEGSSVVSQGDQEAALAAAIQTDEEGRGELGGPGALLVVCRNTNHHAYDDVLLFFGRLMSPVLKLFNFESKLHPCKALHQVCSCSIHFLRTHLLLPLNARAESQYVPPALGTPKPIVQSHVNDYRLLCPGEELYILRACTADAGTS